MFKKIFSSILALLFTASISLNSAIAATDQSWWHLPFGQTAIEPNSNKDVKVNNLEVTGTFTGSAIGDMTKAVYDPQTINGDAFLRSNHNGVFAPDKMATVTDPALDAAVTQAIVDANDGTIITTTAAGNNQTIATPTDTTAGKGFFVVNNDTSTNIININGHSLQVGEGAMFKWDGSAWVNDPIRNSLLAAQSSILMSGLVPSINADPTKFDVSAGVYCIVDAHTDPTKVLVKIINFPGVTAQTVTNLATQDFTTLSMNVNGTIDQNPPSVNFERELIRTNVAIGSLNHVIRTAIVGINRFSTVPAVNIAASLYDLSNVFGTANYQGSFKASPNGANLQFNISAGTQYRMGIDPDDLDDPNFLDAVGQNAPTFIYGWTTTDGEGFKNIFSQTAIIPGSYDDGTAVQADALPQGTVPNNQFAIHHLYYEASTNVVAIQFGRNTYSSIADAAANENNDLGTSENPSLDGFMKVAFIIVKGNATALNDPAQAEFNAGPFIRGSIGGGQVAGTTTLDKAYQNSAQPQFGITDANGALQFDNQRASDTSALAEFLNIAGTIKAWITGEGNIDYDAADHSIGASIGANNLTLGGATSTVVVPGNLTVQGTNTVLDTTTLNIEAKEAVLANVTTPTDVTADLSGIRVKGATDKTLLWQNDNDSWNSNQPIRANVGGTSSLITARNGAVDGVANFVAENDAKTWLFGVDGGNADTYEITVDGGSQFAIETGGDIGVGTTTPSQALEVRRSTATDTHSLVINESNSNIDIGVQARGFNGRGLDMFYRNDDATTHINAFGAGMPIVFDVNSSEVARFDASGNLGIGISPVYKADIAGLLRVGTGSIGTQGGIIGLDAANGSMAFTPGTTGEAFRFLSSNTAAEYARINNTGLGVGVSPSSRLHTSTTGGSGEDVIFSQENANGEIVTIRGKLTADTNYHVGKLSVLREADGNSAMTFQTGTGGASSERMRIDSSGDVGIGTTDPTNLLHIEGTGQIANFDGANDTAAVFARFGTSGSTGQGFIGVEGNTGGNLNTGTLAYATYFGAGASGTALQFGTPGIGVATTILANGDVGIGESAPANKLHVKGSTSSTVANFEYTGTNNSFINLKGSTGNTFVGHKAGDFVVQTASGAFSDKLTVSNIGDVSIDVGTFNVGTGSELTIATGVITTTKSYHYVDTEGDAATDDLDTINGGSIGDTLTLRAQDINRTVVLKDGTGNLRMNGDFSLDNTTDTISFIFDTVWLETSRSDNGA